MSIFVRSALVALALSTAVVSAASAHPTYHFDADSFFSQLQRDTP